MGTVFKRKGNKGPPTWQAKIRRKGHPFLSASFSNQADAEAWVKKVEAEFEANKAVTAAATARAKLSHSADPLHLPFGYLIERYMAEVTPTKRSARVEAIRLKAMMKDDIAALTPAQLTHKVIAAWRDERLTKVSNDTVIRDLGTIGSIIETARREWDLALKENPVRLVRKPRPNPSRERRLLPDEEAAILNEAGNSRGGFLHSIIVLALETAMRQGEIANLDWKFVNLPERRIHLTVTKNGSTRGVPLSKRALAILESLPERSGAVFPGATQEAIKRAFKNAASRAGVEDFHFHDLRHEATSRFFEKGLSMMEVASITGHKSLSMLQRYTHLDAGKLASRLD